MRDSFSASRRPEAGDSLLAISRGSAPKEGTSQERPFPALKSILPQRPIWAFKTCSSLLGIYIGLAT